jgi:hypothetical protein
MVNFVLKFGILFFCLNLSLSEIYGSGEFEDPLLIEYSSTPPDNPLAPDIALDADEEYEDIPGLGSRFDLPDCMTTREKEVFLRRLNERKYPKIKESDRLLVNIDEEAVDYHPIINEAPDRPLVRKEDLLHLITPLLKKIKEDIVPEKVNRKRWFIQNGVKLTTLIACVYLRSLFFANDGAIDDWFGINSDAKATTVGLLSAALYLLPEWLELLENWESVKEYWSDKEGLVKQNLKGLRRLTDGVILLAASGKVAQMLKLYFDVGFQGGLDWLEFGLTMPFMIPNTLARSFRGFKEIADNLWGRFSKGRSPGIKTTRRDLLENLSNAYRKVKYLEEDDLSQLADMFCNIRKRDHSKEEGLLLILSLLNTLYHLDEEEEYRVINTGKHPWWYRASKWMGRGITAVGIYPISLGCKYVMADYLGLVEGDADSYTPDWTTGQNIAVYSFVTVAGGYVLISAGRIIEREFSNLGCWISGYDPNSRRTVLKRHVSSFPKSRIFTAIASGLISPILTLPETSLAGTGFYLQGKEKIEDQLPWLAFASIVESAFMHEGLNGGVQKFFTRCAEYQGGKTEKAYKALKHSLQNLLIRPVNSLKSSLMIRWSPLKRS